jgi:hypothetical protein
MAVGLGRASGLQTGALELPAHLLQLTVRQLIGGGVGLRVQHLRQIDGGVSRAIANVTCVCQAGTPSMPTSTSADRFRIVASAETQDWR